MIIGFAKKPIYRDYINAGVYCLSASTLDYLDYDKHCDMPTLFQRIMQDNKKGLCLSDPGAMVGCQNA